MIAEPVFRLSRRYSIDDWLARLPRRQKAWGSHLHRTDLYVHICDEDNRTDPNRLCEARHDTWFYAAGGSPMRVREGIYRVLELPNVLWTLHGAVHLYCTQKMADELGFVCTSEPEPAHAMAVIDPRD